MPAAPKFCINSAEKPSGLHLDAANQILHTAVTSALHHRQRANQQQLHNRSVAASDHV